MTIAFQVAIVVAVSLAAFYVARGAGARHQAMRRILMVGFVVATASSVFFPQLWTSAAELVGVGRGTDLLLYLLVLSFFMYVASTYRRFRHLERDLTELARQLALANEVKPVVRPRAKKSESTRTSRVTNRRPR